MLACLTLCTIYVFVVVVLLVGVPVWALFFRSHSAASQHSKSVDTPEARTLPFNGANKEWRRALDTRPVSVRTKSALLTDIPSDRMGLGDGLNTATGEPGSRCVVYDPNDDANQVFTASGSEGQRTTYRLERVT